MRTRLIKLFVISVILVANILLLTACGSGSGTTKCFIKKAVDKNGAETGHKVLFLEVKNATFTEDSGKQRNISVALGIHPYDDAYSLIFSDPHSKDFSIGCYNEIFLQFHGEDNRQVVCGGVPLKDQNFYLTRNYDNYLSLISSMVVGSSLSFKVRGDNGNVEFTFTYDPIKISKLLSECNGEKGRLDYQEAFAKKVPCLIEGKEGFQYSLSSYIRQGKPTDVIIPDYYGLIAEGAFTDNPKITSITIPSSVTFIDNKVFSGCTGLTSVTIPSSVTQIGISAFNGCSALKSITLPASIKRMSDSVFCGCTGLTSITIPTSVEEISSKAFRGCTGLTSVTIPKGVRIIRALAFSGCTGLTSVTIPASVALLDAYAFSGCTNLKNIENYSSCEVYIR